MKSAQCETCRRPLGVEQLGCPRRNLGEENLCPYQVEESRLPSADWGFMFFVGLGISMIPLMAILIGESLPLWISAVLLPFMLFGLVIMGIGLYSLFGRQKIIFNPDTGQAWQQTRILGIPVGQTVTSAIETIPWQGGPARGLRYPASVAELCRGGKAAQLITAAVLQMLAQGVIMLGEVKVFRKYGKTSRVYVLLPGEEYSKADIMGELEKRLVSVVAQARCVDAEFEFLGRKYTRTHRSVLCLEDAIRMAFEGGQKSPDQFLIKEVVGKEAVGLGLGELKGSVIQKFSLGKNVSGKIALDARSVEQLQKDFWMTQPEHARDLLAQLDLLTFSMVSSRQHGST